MNTLMIINGSAYGLDSTYNAVRLVGNLVKRDDVEMTVFLMGDAGRSDLRSTPGDGEAPLPR